MAAYTSGSRRPRLYVFVAAFFLAILGLSFVGFHDVSLTVDVLNNSLAYNSQNTRETVVSAWDTQLRSGKSASHAVNDTRLHVLIPANNPDVNLCKTLLTSNALGYPDPVILAWQEKYDTGKIFDASIDTSIMAHYLTLQQITCLVEVATWQRSAPCSIGLRSRKQRTTTLS